MTARDFTPTDEQVEALSQSPQLWLYGYPNAAATKRFVASPAFQSIIAAAKAEAWDEGLDCGYAVDHSDNPYRSEVSA